MSLELYTVPAKVSVPTRTIISAFEQGSLNQLSPTDPQGPDAPAPRTLHPELSAEELAEPGTAKKLLLAFEAKRHSSVTSPGAELPLSGGGGGGKLTTEHFKLFKQDDDKRAVVRNGKPEAVVGVDENEIIAQMEAVVVGGDAEVLVTSNNEAGHMIGDIRQAEVERNSTGSSAVEIQVESAVCGVTSTEPTPSAMVTASQIDTNHTPLSSDTTPPSDVTAMSVPPTVQSTRSSRTVLLVTAMKPLNDLGVALRDLTVSKLKEAGDEVIVSDVFELAADDVEGEYKKLLRSDLIVLQYSTVLNSFPGGLKSWLDSTLTKGLHGQNIDRVTLKGKKSMLLIVTDEDKDSDYNHLQTGVLQFVSLQVLQPEIVRYKPATDPAYSAALQHWTNRLSSIWDEPDIFA